jgi:hypothetical protein
MKTPANFHAMKIRFNCEGSALPCQEQASGDLLFDGFDHVLYPTIPLIAKHALRPLSHRPNQHANLSLLATVALQTAPAYSPFLQNACMHHPCSECVLIMCTSHCFVI